jgi:3-phosphoshikimate 1-carboxyvinyltransferase
MDEVTKLGLEIGGEISIEGSKSILQRVLIISTFINQSLRIANWSACNDVTEMASALGLSCSSGFERDISQSCLQSEIHIEESATALRFLLTLAALQPHKKCLFRLGKRLAMRPHEVLINALRGFGAELTFNGDEIVVYGTRPTLIEIELEAEISSQYISAILLCAPLFENGLIIKPLGKVVSKAYIDLTIAVMKEFGIVVGSENNNWIIPPFSTYQEIGLYNCEPDLSSATYPLSLGMFSKKGVAVVFPFTSSKQPDFQFIEIMRKHGADIQLIDGKIISRESIFSKLCVDVVNTPDLFPVLAFLSLFSRNISVITGITNLVHKESDRLKNLSMNFEKLGCSIKYLDNGIAISPLKENPGVVTLDALGDHRYAMIYYLLSIIFPQVTFTDVDCIAKSYPGFMQDMEILGMKKGAIAPLN